MKTRFVTEMIVSLLLSGMACSCIADELPQWSRVDFDANNYVIFEDVGRNETTFVETYKTDATTSDTTGTQSADMGTSAADNMTSDVFTVFRYGSSVALHAHVDGTSVTWSTVCDYYGVETSITSRLKSLTYMDKYHLWAVSSERLVDLVCLVDLRNGNAERQYIGRDLSLAPDNRLMAYNGGGSCMFMEDVLLYPQVVGGFTSFDGLSAVNANGDSAGMVTSDPLLGDKKVLLGGPIHWSDSSRLEFLLTYYYGDEGAADVTTSSLFVHVQAEVGNSSLSPRPVTVHTVEYDVPTTSPIGDSLEANWWQSAPAILARDAVQSTSTVGTAYTIRH